MWDNNTRAPRVQGSNGRRFCQVLPAGVAERRATGTDGSLRYKALVCSSPYAGTTARTPQQRMIGLGPDHTPTTTSLLHACWQGVIVVASLRAGTSPIRGIIQQQTLSSLQAPNGFLLHPVPLPLPGAGGGHHKLPHQL